MCKNLKCTQLLIVFILCSSFDKIWQLQHEPPPRFNDTSHCISFEKEEEISDVALDKCSVYFLHQAAYLSKYMYYVWLWQYIHLCLLYFKALFILTSHTKANKLLKVKCVQNSGHIPCSNGKKTFELNVAVALCLEDIYSGLEKKKSLIKQLVVRKIQIFIFVMKSQSDSDFSTPHLYLCFCTIFEFAAPHCERRE